MTTYLDSKKGNCFRGDPQKFLYLSFDPKREQLLVHNRDIQLQGLVFEASAKNIDEETGLDAYIPASLTDAIKLALDSLRLAPERSAEVALRLSTLVQSSQLIPDGNYALREQSFIYMLLRRLAKAQLPADVLDENALKKKVYVKRQANEVKREAVDNEQTGKETEVDGLPTFVIDVLKNISEMTTPLGTLRVIPYRRVQGVLNAQFTIRFPNTSEEGLYSFYVHNCPLNGSNSPVRQQQQQRAVNLTIKLVEKNTDGYLSAGEQSLPLLYFVMCCLYFMASLLWFLYLHVSKNSKYRIHYLMFAVVLVKAISLAFHGVNYYVIGKHGVHEEGWAVMYYITHIIRGALLFITILLIGAGWAFIKHMLTPRERSVFLIVIPLQILANIATVVIEESEAGATRYAIWKDIFIFVDLACCGAILFPVVWSIRHLQAASQTDGKAAINLRNLRLFRHFYILVVCYVYFTRVIAYLLTITTPYFLTWIVELFKESITFLFFIAVGYKFRPIDDNPYLLVPNDEADEEEDTVLERIQLEDIWSQSGFTDGLTKLNRPQGQRNIKRTTTGGASNPMFVERAVIGGERQSTTDV
ncbi:Lung seven transmembrane receptor [Paragonimus heterotremus]|uniref:Lung seven transmembrane receptor n=1 Tax=Paragonimus heterotremus TaxID=100268 RepID=A0A8J4T6G6_9TREM|nr:Lung seven transmembrane receptor [Paragonimus heterotremus]